MKKRILIIFLAVFLLIPAYKAFAQDGVTSSLSEAMITATISTDKSSYQSGEEINYTITVENNRDLYVLEKTEISYRNTEGLIAAQNGTLPVEIPELVPGQVFELHGTLVGDSEVFPQTDIDSKTEDSTAIGSENTTEQNENPSNVQDASDSNIWIYVVCAGIVLVLLIVFVICIKKKKMNQLSKKLMIVLLLLGMSVSSFSITKANAASVIKTSETITLRPYVEFMYGGQKVMIRVVMEFKLGMEKYKFSLKDYEGSKRTTCHDPSIFKDFDGTYYVFGTHMALSSSKNLKDWTNLDNSYRASYTAEVKEQIRAWNKDSGSWYGYLWAPDIIYNKTMGKYCIYLSANGDDWKSNIVLLTADVVTGPYQYAGSIVYGGFDETNWEETDAKQVLGTEELPERYIKNGIKNRKWGDMFPNCIDPVVFYDDDGKLWMAYGSWSGGIFILELDEETGLRDYAVTYDTNLHSDAYFGKKIAGGAYVSGEGAYIEKIGDYYWLFVSYGNLEANGGYNIRVYRSKTPDGGYVDALGNDAFSDKYVFNYNLNNKGVRLFGGYQWRSFNIGEVAQGHNSAFVDDDGRAHIIYHTRTTDGTEGHTVRVHQLFLNKYDWLVAAPYQTTDEVLNPSICTVDRIAGKYEVILHELDIDYKNLDVKRPELITLNPDGSITGYYEGSWKLEEETSYIDLNLNGVTYSGVVLEMNIENLYTKTTVFTALGAENQLTLWGSKIVE